MPVEATFTLGRGEDGQITVGLVGPTPVGGQTLRFTVWKTFGGTSGLIVKQAASGYGGGQSGITVLDSGKGTVRVAIRSADTSGLDPGAYAFKYQRLDSGFVTDETKGWFVLKP